MRRFDYSILVFRVWQWLADARWLLLQVIQGSFNLEGSQVLVWGERSRTGQHPQRGREPVCFVYVSCSLLNTGDSQQCSTKIWNSVANHNARLDSVDTEAHGPACRYYPNRAVATGWVWGCGTTNNHFQSANGASVGKWSLSRQMKHRRCTILVS